MCAAFLKDGAGATLAVATVGAGVGASCLVPRAPCPVPRASCPVPRAPDPDQRLQLHAGTHPDILAAIELGNGEFAALTGWHGRHIDVDGPMGELVRALTPAERDDIPVLDWNLALMLQTMALGCEQDGTVCPPTVLI